MFPYTGISCVLCDVVCNVAHVSDCRPGSGRSRMGQSESHLGQTHNSLLPGPCIRSDVSIHTHNSNHSSQDTQFQCDECHFHTDSPRDLSRHRFAFRNISNVPKVLSTVQVSALLAAYFTVASAAIHQTSPILKNRLTCSWNSTFESYVEAKAL